jgi:hypothetical protein
MQGSWSVAAVPSRKKHSEGPSEKMSRGKRNINRVKPLNSERGKYCILAAEQKNFGVMSMRISALLLYGLGEIGHDERRMNSSTEQRWASGCNGVLSNMHILLLPIWKN